MVVTPNLFQYIQYDVSLRGFMIVLCIYKYLGANKVWRLQVGIRQVHNAYRLA